MAKKWAPPPELRKLFKSAQKPPSVDYSDVRAIKEKLRKSGVLKEGETRGRTWSMDVAALAIGNKVTGGNDTGIPAIKIYVQKKKKLRGLPRTRRIPAEFDGIPTDIQEVGVGETHQACLPPTAKHQVLESGVSIGPDTVEPDEYETYGSTGVFLHEPQSGEVFVSTCQHVLVPWLSNYHTVYHPALSIDASGYPIGRFEDGLLSKYPQNPGGDVEADWGLVRLNPGSPCYNGICGVGEVQGWKDPEMQMRVFARGAGSGEIRVGEVVALDADRLLMEVAYLGDVYYWNVFLIHPYSLPKPFSQPGDSGAAILDYEDGKAIGYVVGSIPINGISYTLGYPMKSILHLAQGQIQLIQH